MDDEDKYTRITLRIPRDLHGRLSEEADRTSKSLNAEIVARLASTFQPEQQSLDLGIEPLKTEIQGMRREMVSQQRMLEMLLHGQAAFDLGPDGAMINQRFIRHQAETPEKSSSPSGRVLKSKKTPSKGG